MIESVTADDFWHSVQKSDIGWQCELLQILMSEGPISIIWSAFDVNAGRDYCLLIIWHSILVVRHLQVEIQRL